MADVAQHVIKRISRPGSLSQMACYDMMSNIWQARRSESGV